MLSRARNSRLNHQNSYVYGLHCKFLVIEGAHWDTININGHRLNVPSFTLEYRQSVVGMSQRWQFVTRQI